jgi:uroporphyrinogen-III decarboxylase
MAGRYAEVDKLIDSYLTVVESPENQARGENWESVSPAAYYYWQRIPRPTAGPLPLVVLSMNAFYHHAFGLDLEHFYTDPYTYLKGYLTACLSKFRWFQDDTYYLPEVPIWLGPSFEPSLFGKGVLYAEDQDPWIRQEPVLRVRQDLDHLEPPDFHRSGLMPIAHRMYEEIGDIVQRRLEVRFTDWLRGPFVLAFHLRGAGNILTDMIDDPAYVHRLLRFITDARMGWSRDRAKFLGEDIGPGDLYNDEVNVPLLSPAYYREFILPYETELSEFYGEIGYWHSCGDTGPLAVAIRTIPNLKMVNISGWTDFDQAAEAYADTGLTLEANIHPLKDLQQATEDEMRRKVAYIARRRKELGINAMFVRVDSLELLRGVEKDIGVAQRWLEVAKDAMEDAEQSMP